MLDLAIDLMGKRNRWSEVAGEMSTFVRDAGFSVVESFVGHGIGREMHEDPQVPNFVSAQLRRNGDFALEPGLVIAVEPKAFLPGLGAVGVENTYVVTAEGPVSLCDSPLEIRQR